MFADPQWLVTLTFTQPDASGPIPDRHALCDPRTHIYQNADGSYRWRVMSRCEHCCRYVSEMQTKWRKRLRRRFGDHLQFIRAYEDHPTSGALHIHYGVVGLPLYFDRKKSPEALAIKQHWYDVDGGWVDLSPRHSRHGEALGHYLGKYIAKRHDNKIARAFRRWSRTAGFAPEISMRVLPPPDWVPTVWLEPHADIEHIGWQHPETRETVPDRVWEVSG
jgi:hypothetical protein